jgi:hypothetical protein
MTVAEAQAVVAPVHIPSKSDLVVNVIAFQIAWFACVVGAGRGLVWLGLAVLAAVVALHLVRAPRKSEELKLIAISLVIGVVWDSLLVATGWITFASHGPYAGIAPHWILALWALFATTLNMSLHWLKGRWALAAVLGGIAGPLSYWGAANMGAVTFVNPVAGLAALAVGWAVMMPLLSFIAIRFDGIHTPVCVQCQA